MNRHTGPFPNGSLVAAGMALFLAACASRATLVKPPGSPPSAEAVHLSDVPFFSNTTDQCGPSALASVLNYWGKNVAPEDVKADVYLPKLKGSLPMDMRPALTKHGLSGRVIAGSFDDIKAELRQKRPVIAYLDFGTRRHPIGHFLVVVGFDEKRRGLIVHSGGAQNKFATYRRFNRGWSDTDHWMLVAGPEGALAEEPTPSRRVPQFEARMTADDHFQLGSAYEAQHLKAEAAVQYQRALEQNKKFEPALMAMGNLAFEKGDFKTAEKYYRRVLRNNSDHGGANNNLAMVYLSSGRKLPAAQRLATKALSTDYRPYALDTLAQISARLLPTEASGISTENKSADTPAAP